MISIGTFFFILSKIEDRLSSLNYEPAERTISIQKISWTNLDHPTRPIQSLHLSLWSFPPKITVDGMTISSFSSSNLTSTSSHSSSPNLEIDVRNISLNLENLPPIHDLKGSISPELHLQNDNLSIKKQNESWDISGTLPFQHTHLSTTIQFSIKGEQIEILLSEPKIAHPLLERQYTLPDIPWVGTRNDNEINLKSEWSASELKLNLKPNFSEPKSSSISISSQLAFSDLIDWFEIKKQLRPKEFSVQGDLLLRLTWEKNTFQNISFDKLNEQLFELEFRREDFVAEPGEFAVRGGILDIFPYSSQTPFRIEFFGDEISRIRSFDIESQRSDQDHSRVKIISNIQVSNESKNIQNIFEILFNDTTIFFQSLKLFPR